MTKPRFSFSSAPVASHWIKKCLRVAGGIFLCGSIICVTANLSLAQAPGWSRGLQSLSINFDECTTRARRALEAEGYRVENQGGSFGGDYYFGGAKQSYSAVIACDSSQNGTWANVFVASLNSNGAVAGAERQRLQARMERSGQDSNSFETWTWAYAPPGQQPEPHGEVRMYADGRASWSGDGRTGKWSRSGNQIVFDWRPQNDSVDTLYLSRDGTVMTGANRDGWNIRATKQ